MAEPKSDKCTTQRVNISGKSKAGGQVSGRVQNAATV